jgi:hypothetical protein
MKSLHGGEWQEVRLVRLHCTQSLGESKLSALALLVTDTGLGVPIEHMFCYS